MKKEKLILLFAITLLLSSIIGSTIVLSSQEGQAISSASLNESLSSEENIDLTDEPKNTLNFEREKDSTNKFVDFVLPFIIEFFGAFLGILTAVWLDKHIEKQKYKSLNQELFEELQQIKEELIKRYEKKDDFVYFRYLTPIWNIHMESGNLQLLTRIINQDYIKVYTRIQYAQELESEYIHCKVNSSFFNNSVNNDKPECSDPFVQLYIDELNNNRSKEAKKIMDDIEALEEKYNDAGNKRSRQQNQSE